MPKFNFKKEKIPFTQVANSVLNDKKISAKAKGLYAYLYSKPEGWDFAIDRIALDFTDGRKAINNGLKELEEYGYLLRERQPTGRVVYLLKSQMPVMDMGLLEPNAPNGQEPKRPRAKRGIVSNKDIIVIKNNSNKDTRALAVDGGYSEHKTVKLTDEEYRKLGEQIGSEARNDLIEQLGRYIMTQGKNPYKSHYAAIQTWARKRKDQLAAKHKTFTVIG